MASSNYNPLPTPFFDWKHNDHAEAFINYKEWMEMHLISQPKITADIQWSTIVLNMGEKGRELWKNFGISQERRKDPENVWAAFEQHFTPSNTFWSFREETYRIQPQGQKETCDALEARINLLLKRCKYDAAVEEIKKQEMFLIACKYFEVKKLIRESKPDLKFQEIMDKARMHERACKEYGHHKNPQDEPGSVGNPLAVDSRNFTKGKKTRGKKDTRRVHSRESNHSSSRNSSPGRPRTGGSVPMLSRPCDFCAKLHAKSKNACPAYGKKCPKCGHQNHFAQCCKRRSKDGRPRTPSRGRSPGHGHDRRRSFSGRRHHRSFSKDSRDGRRSYSKERRSSSRNRYDVTASSCMVGEEDEYFSHCMFNYAVEVAELGTEDLDIDDGDGLTSHIAKLELFSSTAKISSKIMAKANSGSEVNILPRRTLDLLGLKVNDLHHTSVSLLTYDKRSMSVLGKIGLQVLEPYSKKSTRALFFVTRQDNIPLIGYALTKKLALLNAPNFAQRRTIAAMGTSKPNPSRKKREGQERRSGTSKGHHRRSPLRDRTFGKDHRGEDVPFYKQLDEWTDPTEARRPADAQDAELPGAGLPEPQESPSSPAAHPPMDTRIEGIDHLKKLFPTSFDTLGNLPGKYHMHLDPTVKPVQHARRLVPIEKREKIEKELQEMVRKGVITPQIEPTPWVSSLTYPVKSNGQLRICLDPKDLNKAVIRENHKAPTLQEITHKLSGAMYFSKLDAQKGFWSVHLDHPSSVLTTFNTHKGRFRFLRMPFGLKMSQDVFQMKMDQIIERVPGVIAIHNDIAVYGRTKEEHDRHLLLLMTTCHRFGLVFNSAKCDIKKEKIAFYGKMFTQRGIEPDPAKIQGITDMPPPRNIKELQSFLGMVNFMQPFIPHLSHHSSPLRMMLKKENEFVWTKQENSSFQQIKTLIRKTSFLSYYDRHKPVIVQADASQYGIGAALIQDGKPVAFASKSLSATEQRYANIEREMLSVVFACERFHTYLSGRTFLIQNDHKPLEMIQLKNLKAAPPRLQRMLLRIQSYDCVLPL